MRGGHRREGVGGFVVGRERCRVVGVLPSKEINLVVRVAAVAYGVTTPPSHEPPGGYAGPRSSCGHVLPRCHTGLTPAVSLNLRTSSNHSIGTSHDSSKPSGA